MIHTILIVDDEPFNHRVLKLKFENAGYKVVAASNGLDGLNKFKTESPDVVITDINMPVMDGREMCSSLREIGCGRQFLTIVVTSLVDKAERQWVNDLENTICIEKPVSPNNLLATVEDYFKKPVS